LILVLGCATDRFASHRSSPLNPLAAQLRLLSRSGPQVSSRTAMLLRRYDLLDVYQRQPQACLDSLLDLQATEPAPEKMYAIAELAYIMGQRAQRQSDSQEALEKYSLTLTHTYLYLFSEEMDGIRNPYDPQFRGACDLYNQALEATLRLVQASGQLRPGESYELATQRQTFEVTSRVRGNWSAEEFSELLFCSDFDVERFDNATRSFGIGVPLIAIRRSPDHRQLAERYYPAGLAFPVTAVLRVDPDRSAGGRSGDLRQHCVLELHDPLASQDVHFGSRRVPLQTDLSTPLAYFLDTPQFRQQTDSTLGLINPQKTSSRRGIYMLEPFDPDRIPVVMVHGLWSSPMTWMPMFNDLRSFDELRRHYQFWFYQYPTGQPFWFSAAQMRQDLAELQQNLNPRGSHVGLGQMVLVGHSMGGLVSRMQTIDSGDRFWQIVSDAPFEQVRGSEEELRQIEELLFFAPNPTISRVVTIGTPHRGSDYANDLARWVGRQLIKLPHSLTDSGLAVVRDNAELFRDASLLTRLPTSIDSLSPSSPIFPVMLAAPSPPHVRYHNIVGVIEQPGLLGRINSTEGDGVVSLASARMDEWESQLVVEASHQTIHTTPTAILEVRRILLEHLRQSRSVIRLAGAEDWIWRE
jgi:pimeloyl-ACP methyl ester carboxylesterase